MKIYRCIPRVFVASLALLFAGAAWAYIPPSGFLLRTLARKHAGYRRIQVKTQVSRLDSSGQPTGVRFTEQTVYYPAAGTLRSWAYDDQGRAIYEVERNDLNVPAAARLLFDSRSARLIETMKAKGLPIPTEMELEKLANEDDRRAAEKEEMIRWNQVPAWVIGDLPTPSPGADPKKAASIPQLWMEKDAFLPLRLIAPLRDGDSSLSEMRYEEYRSHNEFPYPETVTWLMDGKTPYLRADAVEVSADSGADLSRQPVHEGWTAAGNSAPGPVRDLVSGYYSVLR